MFNDYEKISKNKNIKAMFVMLEASLQCEFRFLRNDKHCFIFDLYKYLVKNLRQD